MKLTGILFNAEGLDEYDCDVHEAVVTTKKISLDWREEGQLFHAVLHSTDGTGYTGTFGSPIPEKGCVMEATRFQAKDGEVLLWLTWYRKDTGWEGVSIVRLAETWED